MTSPDHPTRPEIHPLADLRCTHDGGALESDGDVLRCSACEARFAVVGGIPDFVHDSPTSTARWRAAQRYELHYWTDAADPPPSDQAARWEAAARGLAARFDDAVGPGWRARVLHVGPAGHGEIHHLPARERWAAEPLAIALDLAGRLDRTEGLRWVAAMGERLPFADAWFSAALLPNVIDHVADPARLLEELSRCLAPGAPVWISGHVARAPFASLLAALGRTRIGYFAGHPWAFSERSLDALVSGAGLSIVAAHTGPAVEAAKPIGLRARLKDRVIASRYLLAHA